ncbi:VCBS repeat-containing protein [Bradyrhizobium japonicum]|uniref:FG-GAP repeat domain-containing protein n=1 Tax=Bradyrhizobium japonicum TaxID=375 RepID=UPI001BAC5CBD|nr:VCBS repeat-containing protein [Bradyrhizobium japonicum]MBR0731086.1 VCBS repeat-containing protein [Bradyrhizobium japonicum]MBR0809844.1 VCBS repeat-containing protein [Bradyrhizobium japonicum]
MTALESGTFVARPETKAGCACDIAVALAAKSGEGFVELMRGNEDGTFAVLPGGVLTLDSTPVVMTSGRFRQDVPFDGIVAVTSRPGENGRAHVFVPKANGSYGLPDTGEAVFAVGPEPVAIATGDFNGDGRLDVAVANRGDTSLTILFGTGTGTFAPGPTRVGNLGGIPESMTSGKFSGSSSTDDIAIGVTENVGGALRVGVAVVSRDSTGAFQRKPVRPVGQLNSRGSRIAAANLSGLLEGSSGRRFRDIAIAYLDHTPSGNAIGRVTVLLGQDSGGFRDTAAQTIDLGAQPRSIRIADLDDDGTVDLIVSTYGDLASSADGTVRFFQGRAAPVPDPGFRTNAAWFTIPETTGIRPRSLVAGRFGRNKPDGSPPSMGVAAINARNLDTVSVFIGNGLGAFVQPSLVTTDLRPEDRLFVSGDFNSTGGDNPLTDIAFVTKVNDRNVVAVLLSNGAGGFERTFGRRTVLAGEAPRLITAGRFTSEGVLGLAIVDETGGLQQQPLLKVFFGEGQGTFRPGSELTLSGIGRVRAIATGRFRGPAKPLDIVVASDTGAANGGRLTLLFNDGLGQFKVGSVQTLDFTPSSVVASDRLRPERRTDLLVRDANADRFLYLLSIDDAGNFRPANNSNRGFSTGAGNVDSLLVGDVATAGASNKLDDVVTYDRDMTLKVFVNNGDELFSLSPMITPPSGPSFQGAQPSYVLTGFGAERPGLAAPTMRNGKIGILLLQGDGQGRFSVSTGDIPPQPFGASVSSTEFSFSSPSTFQTLEIQTMQTMAAQFRSFLHGNNKADLAFITQGVERSLASGMCPTDPKQFPPPLVVPATPDQEVCTSVRHTGFDCTEILKPSPCFITECSIKPGRPASTIPAQALCRKTNTFGPAMALFGNTCED